MMAQMSVCGFIDSFFQNLPPDGTFTYINIYIYKKSLQSSVLEVALLLGTRLLATNFYRLNWLVLV